MTGPTSRLAAILGSENVILTELSPVLSVNLEFPNDPKCWEIEDQYLFGPDYLVAPILNAGQFERSAYLPAGARWQLTSTGECF